MSLRLRLTLSIGLLALISVAALGFAVYNLVGSQLNGRTDDELAAQVDGLTRAIEAAPAGGEAVAARSFIDGQALSGSRLLVAQVPGSTAPISNQGSLLELARATGTRQGDGEGMSEQATEREQLQGLLDSEDGFETVKLADVGEVRLLTRRVQFADASTVVVQAGEPEYGTDQAQEQVAKTFLLIGALTVLGAVGVGLLIATRTARPLEEMAERAAAVDGGRLDVRMGSQANIAEVTALAESFDRMLDRLEASFASQRSFLADASHELRTPLTAIIGQSQVLAADPDPDSGDIARVTATIEREAARMRTLIDGMLQLARLDAGQLGAPGEIFDLADVAAEVVSAHPPHEVGQVEISSAGPTPAFGHREETVRIVRNLLDNALAYGRGAVRIEVGTPGPGRAAVLSVDDDGPGIDPSDRDRVFDRFARLEASRSRELGGFGLGLAISRELAEAQEGTIEAGDSVLGGARFTLRLPSIAVGE